VRGFPEKSSAARELLETVGRSFLTGYAYAAQARTPADAEERLEGVAAPFRGFAYEGAAMAFAVLDALPFGGSRRVETFLAGRGADHVYMAYVGVGWAMARVPRFRWSKLYAPDPLLQWLVLDGYGFHQAYFHTQRYVHQQFREPRFPWPVGGPRWYADRAIDQGIGRAMWFVGGTDVDLVATMIDKFPARRRPDLYSGAGLAATYAGGADEAELRRFVQRAGEHRGQLAQASAFAATARIRAGLVTPHTHVATGVFCGMTPEDASRLSDELRPDHSVSGPLPAYEVWRRRIADEFVLLGRS
jgi:enediyne biosynthesis protein E3